MHKVQTGAEARELYVTAGNRRFDLLEISFVYDKKDQKLTICNSLM